MRIGTHLGSLKRGLALGLALALAAGGVGSAKAQTYRGFAPPVASVKEPRLALDVFRGALHSENTHAAGVNVGGRFALGAGPFDSVLELTPAIAAQFDLRAPSMELVNADYRLGAGFTRAHQRWEGRVELYHQSSHLGDEYLLREQPERVNVNFETLELLMGYRLAGARAYAGLDYRLGGNPPSLPQRQWLLGLEWRPAIQTRARPVLAWHGTRDRDAPRGSNSFTVGVELGPHGPRRNALRIALVHFQGNSPFGQFFELRIRYTGVALELLH